VGEHGTWSNSVESYLVCFEAQLTVNKDLNELFQVVQPDSAHAPTVAVCIVALAKGERVEIRVALEVNGAVVEKSAHRTTAALILVDDQYQTVELGSSVERVGCVVGLAVLDVPHLQVAATALHAIGTEGQLSCPFAVVMQGVVGPERTTLAAGVGRGEDDAVGEDLGRVVCDTPDAPVGDVLQVLG
jgi:hypothetical protein